VATLLCGLQAAAATHIKIDVLLPREGNVLAAHCHMLCALGIVQLVGSTTCIAEHIARV
jgi:hypothetical protein